MEDLVRAKTLGRGAAAEDTTFCDADDSLAEDDDFDGGGGGARLVSPAFDEDDENDAAELAAERAAAAAQAPHCLPESGAIVGRASAVKSTAFSRRTVESTAKASSRLRSASRVDAVEAPTGRAST